DSASTSTVAPPKLPVNRRPFRLAHQTLVITNIDFTQCVLVGYTQLVIWPLDTTLRRIYLNANQCRIHRVCVEGAEENFRNSSSLFARSYPPVDVHYMFNDPCLEICKQDCKYRTLDNFETQHASVISSVDPDNAAGELSLLIPLIFNDLIREQSPLLITIEFSLNQPKNGFHFVVPDEEGQDCAFAFSGGPPNSSRFWFPCIDCSEPCTWKIEVTVDEEYVAIAPGDLLGPPEYTEDLRRKTYQFYLAQPTSAPCIGLAAGAFEIVPDSSESTFSTVISHFCPKGLRKLLEHSVQNFAGIIDYYEGELASQFPYRSLSTVFVDRAYEDYQSFASLIIFSVDLLFSRRIIDQAIATRRVLSVAVAQQIFGCVLIPETWAAAWLTYGISNYLAGLYQKRVFGNNEYRFIIDKYMKEVTHYEHNYHGIYLDPTRTTRKTTYFSLKDPHVISPEYLSAYIKKAHLAIRILAQRFGPRLLLQVLNKIYALARQSTTSMEDQTQQQQRPNVSPTNPSNNTEQISAVPPMLTDENRANLLLSSESFRRIISTVTGQDIGNYLDTWVYNSGHVRLNVKFNFNRKRNVVEIDLKEDRQSEGHVSYLGPMTALLQELDGPFMHTFKLEEGRTTRDLQCHSKSRKHKKKKIPLSNGEEVEMDISRIDSDSPLLWLRLDPELSVIRSINIEQADNSWYLMLSYDRDCLGQLEAVHALSKFPSPETRHALLSIIADDQMYYRVRTEACNVLCQVANEMSSMGSLGMPGISSVGAVGSTSGHHHQNTSVLIPLFWQLYSSPLQHGLVRQNDFSNLQRYFLQKAIVRAVSALRVQQVCPRDVIYFLVELNKYNDNSRNAFSDCYYQAELIRALAGTLTPVIMMKDVLAINVLPDEVRTVLEEIVRCLNVDSQFPTYKRMVTVECLKAIRRLQRLGFIPVDPTLFYSAATPGHYADVRLSAIECLVDFVHSERDADALNWLFQEIIEKQGCTSESYPYLRYKTVCLLIQTPPFGRGEGGTKLDTPQLADRIWRLMNVGCAGDSRLRCAVTDLYYTLYQGKRPSCLPLADGMMVVRVKEGRSLVGYSEAEPLSSSSFLDDSRRPRGGGGLDLSNESESFDSRSSPTPKQPRMEHLSDDDDDFTVRTLLLLFKAVTIQYHWPHFQYQEQDHQLRCLRVINSNLFN
ncbi:unnamed protein product, partial [Hymenolepis diminuta]